MPELPAALLEHICSRVSCLATLARVSASSTQLAAAAARPLSELWQRWEGFVAQASRIDASPTPTQKRAMDRAVIAFALNDAQTKVLPASLDNVVRKWVHGRTGQLRLTTQSYGYGAKRRLHMTKPAGWVMSWTPAPVPLPPGRAPLDDGWRPWRPHWRHLYDDFDNEDWTSEEEDSSDEWLGEQGQQGAAERARPGASCSWVWPCQAHSSCNTVARSWLTLGALLLRTHACNASRSATTRC